MMNNDVPTAVLNFNPVKKTKAGIIKNPPPAPTKPVKKPINKPSITTQKVLNFVLLDVISLRPRIIEKEANTSKPNN